LKPLFQCLWMTDTVEYDPQTGRPTIFGIHNAFRVTEGVDYAPGVTMFFAVRGLHGETRLLLRYVDLSNGDSILDRPLRVEGTPLETTDVTVRVNRVPVPHEVVYAWELWSETEMLESRRVEVFLNAAEEES
jgi:hypothetical protein